MKINCSNRAIKYVMLSFNFIFVITGIILIGIGATVKANYSTYESVLSSGYFSLPNMLIATGIIIFLISFLGCYGAMKDNWVMMMAFSILLTIVFIFEFSVGIAGYVLKNKTTAYLTEEFNTSLMNYNNSTEVQYMWDLIQEEFQCCGVNGPGDWNKAFSSKHLPISCCPRKQGEIGVFYCNAVPVIPPTTIKPTAQPSNRTKRQLDSPENLSGNTVASSVTPITTTIATTITPTKPTTPYPETSSTPYSEGCAEAFGTFIKSHAVDIGAVGFILAIIQMFGIGFSFHLARLWKNGYYST